MVERAYPEFMSGGWKGLAYEYFREGVSIHWLVRGNAEEPSLAILKYEPGARVPLHRHAGLETILILDGIQSDENGDYAAGTLVMNAKGTEHSVWSTEGCAVLIHWNLPVVILEGGKVA